MEKLNVYENIATELKRLIEVGALKSGEKLPSVRAYAIERRVNPNTVAKAYSALEKEGFIEVQPKKGAFVRASTERKRSWESELRAQMLAWKESGVTRAEAERALREIFVEAEEKDK